MSKKLIPRKIKKACKVYRNYVPLKTKWSLFSNGAERVLPYL
ncbi:hypothetical protein [Prevotella sp. oral taxon 299]|nr:hypothetical protein [Prevotella sp. oral taxon 299]